MLFRVNTYHIHHSSVHKSPSLQATRCAMSWGISTELGQESCLKWATSSHCGQIRILGLMWQILTHLQKLKSRREICSNPQEGRECKHRQPCYSILASASSLPLLMLLFLNKTRLWWLPSSQPLRRNPSRKGLVGSAPGWKGPEKKFNRPALGSLLVSDTLLAVYFHFTNKSEFSIL